MTEAELLAEVQRALHINEEGSEDFLTTEEWCVVFDREIQATRRRLKLLLKLGRLERGTVKRENLKGILQPRMAYRLIPATGEDE